MNYLSNILCTMLACMLLASCTEKLPENDTQILMLKGSVHSIDEEFYFGNYSFDKVVLNEKLYQRYYLFNDRGYYTEFIHTNVFLGQQNKPNIIDSAEYIISDTLQIENSIISNDSIEWVQQPAKLWENKNESFIEPDYIRKDYRYLNDSVHLISNFDKNGDLLFYDDCRMLANRLSLVKTYTKTDELLSKTDYDYDSKGRLIRKNKYYEKISYKTDYDYCLGRKYESSSYTSRHSVSTFNNSGLLKKLKNYMGDARTSTLYYKYDKIGNIISLREKDEITGKEKISTYSYKYDKENNWTERIEKRYDGNIFVTRRHINYTSILSNLTTHSIAVNSS